MKSIRAARAGAFWIAILFASSAILFVNLNPAHADILDSSLTGEGRMVCVIYTEINPLNNFSFPAFTFQSQDECLGEQPPSPPASQCSNGTDDDADGKIDSADPACHTDGNASNASSYNPNLDNEALAVAQCKDGLDNDGDGKKDFGQDPGCSSAEDNDETDPSGGGNGNPPPAPQCSNGTDDDGDSKVDSADPACHTDFNAGNASSYDPLRNNEAAVAPQCSDAIDNDSDGLVDSADPSCHSDFNAGNSASYTPSFNNESAIAPACADGTDNDSDGKTDYPNDPGCNDANDDDEDNPAPSSGGGGGGGGGGSAIASQVAPGLVLGTSTAPYVAPHESCDQYLWDFIREGRNNNSEQVKRLQYVLIQFEGANIPMSGVYDAATLAAVHAFQTKYAAQILTPWGIGESTGFVYLTTRKQINEIYCKGTNQFPLTPAEQAIIDKARVMSHDNVSQSASVANETAGKSQKSAEESSTTSQSPSVRDIWNKIYEFFKTPKGEEATSTGS